MQHRREITSEVALGDCSCHASSAEADGLSDSHQATAVRAKPTPLVIGQVNMIDADQIRESPDLRTT